MQWKSVGKTPLYELEKFREQLGIGVNEYPRMEPFKRRVLHVAIDQINDYSDIIVKYTQHKDGRSISGFSFNFEHKKKKTIDVKPEINLTAKFSADKHSIVTNATAGGTVTGAGNFDYNSNITVKATPNTGYVFSGWYENGSKVSDSQTYSFVVKSNRTLEARFTANKYNVIVNTGTGGTATGGGSFSYNSTVTVKATASTGYSFAGWYVNGTKISDSQTYSFTHTKEITLF